MIPFSPPYISEKTIQEVVDTLKSGWITTGPKTKLLEKRIKTFLNVKKVHCQSSATSALELVLRWYGIKEGDEIILPAYTFCATANVIMHTGATPIFVDSKKNNPNIDVNEIEKHITEKTKIIISVDISGYPVDYNEINELIEDKKNIFKPNSINQKKLNRILYLSDAAHSFGAKYKNKMVGSDADFTVFSFHAVKNLTTAEGGALSINLPENLFSCEDVYKWMNNMSLHGQDKDALAKFSKKNWKYDVVNFGYKCNMTDIHASIGLGQLLEYDKILNRRKEIYNFYNNFFLKYDFAILPSNKSDKETSNHLYFLRIKNITESQRDMLVNLIADLNVSVNVHFKPIPLLTVYRSFKEKCNIKNAIQIYQNVISLPIYYTLTNDQMKIVAKVVVEAYYKLLENEKTI